MFFVKDLDLHILFTTKILHCTEEVNFCHISPNIEKSQSSWKSWKKELFWGNEHLEQLSYLP